VPTIIDALVVELGFDANGLEAGRKKVQQTFNQTRESAEKTGKDIEKSAKSAEQYITRLRNNVLALFAAFTAGRGVKDFLSDMTTSDAALGRFAKTVGQSAEEIASWRAAGKLMGVDARDIDSTFSNLVQQFQQFSLTGDSTLVPWFRALGLSMSDATGKMKPVNELLLELAERVQGLPPERATAFLTNMGISPGMINLLLQGPPAIRKLIDSQRELAKAHAADIAAAQERQRVWNAFLNQAERVGVVLLTTLTPAMIAVAGMLEEVARWAGDNPDAAAGAFGALTGVTLLLSGALLINLAGSALTAVAAGFAGLVSLSTGLLLRMAVMTATAIPALSKAFFGLALAIESTPIGWIVTGIALISAAGFLLYRNWNSISSWWKRLWSGMSDDTTAATDKMAKKLPAPPASGKPTSGAYGSKGGPTREGDVQTLMGKGWTREQATGIVASIQSESTGRTDAVGDNGRAFGLAQWHPDRQARFKNWTGKDIREASRAEQLAFIDHELRNEESGAGQALANTRDAGSAAKVVSRLYERPASDQGELRAAIAQAMIKAPSTATVPATAVASSVAGNRYQTNNNKTDVRVGSMTVNTQATDARGIAGDITPALQNSFAQMANSGPT
jgi:hypothetical protein